MPQIRDLSRLHPVVFPLAVGALKECEQRGYNVLVIETFRELDVAKAYWAQGRAGLDYVNALRVAANLPRIDAAENERKITRQRPGTSWHCFGCALDIIPMLAGKKPDWDYDEAGTDPDDKWDEIAAVFQTFGFKWGKSFHDLPHIEFHPGWTSTGKALEWMLANGGNWVIPLQS